MKLLNKIIYGVGLLTILYVIMRIVIEILVLFNK